MWKPGDLLTWIQRSMSRIPVINEISFPRDSRVLAQFRKAAAQQQRRARQTFIIFKQNPFDPRLRSHKIQKLSAPELRRQLGERGVQKVREHYSWDRVARDRLKDYEAALRN